MLVYYGYFSLLRVTTNTVLKAFEMTTEEMDKLRFAYLKLCGALSELSVTQASFNWVRFANSKLYPET